jgi:hypothetical protein
VAVVARPCGRVRSVEKIAIAVSMAMNRNAILVRVHSRARGQDEKHQGDFAGSSEATLRRMCCTEPFYNGTPLEPFELLGEEFVRAMVVKVNRLSRYSLTQRDALAAFGSLKRTPRVVSAMP